MNKCDFYTFVHFKYIISRICVVKKTKNNEWSERLNILEQHINYWINPSNKTNKTIETIQLYYDT